ncbi:NUDIX hydrolase [Zobellia laminariae]|uniref:CoA pyrophosphatase n=1 Tax=Zobellia barbeyronii TaxID=2748009 RepID=A0ABS5WE80_9FLAO|nr:CoA pyrophosphatase [Zobellia barbeyronii]MBT2161702.1 CoA pyrophosphatase [Zobellia barbeyronii]MUH41649.1 CoA pyrophosphatase [Zobellia laminariae]
MNFDDFSIRIPKIKNLPLPGEASHLKMAPQFRLEELQDARKKPQITKKAAVMALFYPDEANLTRLLLILRKSHPKDVHSNQIGFPGGQVEAEDINMMATALRETHEEVGVEPNSVKIIKSLTEIYIPPSNFDVHPFMGLYNGAEPFLLQETEVEELVEVPLMDFMDDANIFTEEMTTSYASNVPVPAFKLNGYTVWGATGMMLSEIKALLQQVL